MNITAELHCWIADVAPDNRATIQESEYIYVWVFDSDGLYSGYYSVRVPWGFLD